MARIFDPRRVLARIDRTLVTELLERHEAPRPDDLTADPFHGLLRQMHHEQIRRLVLVLQDVNEIADPRGLAALAEQVQGRHPARFGVFLAQASRADKIV